MKLSIVIPTYNRAELIGRALRSIRFQEIKNQKNSIEVIIVDNGNDNTKDVVDQFQAERPDLSLIYIYRKERGLNRARNMGALRASSQWVAFLDSDDEYVEGGLDIIFSTISEDTQNINVFGFMTLRELNGVMGPRGYNVGGKWETYKPTYEDIVLKRNMLGDVHFVIRKNLFSEGFKFPEDIQGFEISFFSTMARCGKKFIYINKIVDRRYTDGFEHVGSYVKWPKQYARHYVLFIKEHKEILKKNPKHLAYLCRSAGSAYLRTFNPVGFWWLGKSFIFYNFKVSK